MESLLISNKSFYKLQPEAYNIMPGWNEYVAELHTKARRAFKAWIELSRDRQGPLFEQKKCANANFKYALQFITDFWKEVRVMNNGNMSLLSLLG